MLLFIFQVLVFVVGIIAYYFALFMYEDEQGELSNRVEQLWVAINDRKKISGGLAAALLNKVAEIVKRAFDRIFGRKLFSVQLIGVSVCYALAATCFVVTGLFIWLRARLLHLGSLPATLPPDTIPNLSLAIKAIGIGAAIFLGLGILPAVKRSVFTIFLSLIPLILIITGSLKLALRREPMSPHFGLMFGLLLSFMSDVALLALVRFSLRQLSRESRISRILIAIAMQVAVIGVLVLLPFELSGSLMVKHGRNVALQSFFALAIFNLFTGFAASLFLLTLVFVLLHRAFWPLLDRIVYPVAARRLLGNSGIMATFGTACMTVASPLAWRMIKGVVAWFHYAT